MDLDTYAYICVLYVYECICKVIARTGIRLLIFIIIYAISLFQFSFSLRGNYEGGVWIEKNRKTVRWFGEEEVR